MADEKGDIPILNSHDIGKAKIAIETALGEREKHQFKNLLKNHDMPHIKSYCYGCYGKLMHQNENYFLKNSDGYSKLSGEWHNLRKK